MIFVGQLLMVDKKRFPVPSMPSTMGEFNTAETPTEAFWSCCRFFLFVLTSRTIWELTPFFEPLPPGKRQIMLGVNAVLLLAVLVDTLCTSRPFWWFGNGEAQRRLTLPTVGIYVGWFIASYVYIWWRFIAVS